MHPVSRVLLNPDGSDRGNMLATVLLLPVDTYPEVGKRRDRFLVQAAWVDDVATNVIDKVMLR